MKYKDINGYQILTELAFTDEWSAVTRDYEPGAPIGFGNTEQESIDNLMDEITRAQEKNSFVFNELVKALNHIRNHGDSGAGLYACNILLKHGLI